MTNDNENPRGLPVAFISSRQLRGIADASLGYRPRSVMLSRDHTRNRRIGLVTDTDYEKLLGELAEMRADNAQLQYALEQSEAKWLAVEDMRANDRRYRFLRDCKSDEIYVMAFDPEGDAPCCGGEIMDRHIDAALAAEGRE